MVMRPTIFFWIGIRSMGVTARRLRGRGPMHTHTHILNTAQQLVTTYATQHTLSLSLTLICHTQLCWSVCHYSLCWSVCHYSLCWSVCHYSLCWSVCHYSLCWSVCHYSLCWSIFLPPLPSMMSRTHKDNRHSRLSSSTRIFL